MVSNPCNFSTPGSGENSTHQDRPASEKRSPNNSSLTANNRPTAINPASPAHDLRGQAVGERSIGDKSTPQTQKPKLRDYISFRLEDSKVGGYLLERRRDFRSVFAWEIPDAS
jgi:hypothetical protein